MSDMTPEYVAKVIAAAPFADNEAGIPQMVELIRAQAAELTRLRAKVEAADKLAEALADAVGALDGAGEELSDFANILSRDPWQANHAYESAVQARAALSTYEDAAK